MRGIITKVYGLYYAVYCEGKTLNCYLRGRIRQNEDLKRYSNPAAVGDFIDFDVSEDGTGTIRNILERKNIFSRKEKGRTRKEDIIACNLDLIVVVQSFDKPPFNMRFVDRLLVRGVKAGIPVILCVNKLDLAMKEQISYIKRYYKNVPVSIVLVSALTGEGVEALRRKLLKSVSIFVGYSGVGKSSLLNALFPELNLRISEVSESTGKGRHTTTNVEMISHGNASIIDTPGLREFGLMDLEPDDLGRYFHEFSRYADLCEFSPCSHDHEPNCEVKRQVDQGKICEDRYISYLNILYSLRDYYNRKYQ